MDRLNYFYLQRVSEGELDLGFTKAEEADWEQAIDQGIFGVLVGLACAESSPLGVSVTAALGVGIDQEGRRCAVPSPQVVSVANDTAGNPTAVTASGQERIVSVFLRFARLEYDPRTDGNLDPLNFRKDESFEFIVRQGAQATAGSAVPPALESNGILLVDITRTFGQVSIANADLLTARRQDAIVLAGTPRAIRRGRVNEALTDLLGHYNQHVTGGQDKHPAADVTTTLISGSPQSLVASNVQAKLADLLGYYNAHVTGTADKHAASAVTTSPVLGAPRSLPIGNVQGNLADLLGYYDDHVTGAADRHADTHSDAAAISGAPNSLTAGTVRHHVTSLLGFVNSLASSAVKAQVFTVVPGLVAGAQTTAVEAVGVVGTAVLAINAVAYLSQPISAGQLEVRFYGQSTAGVRTLRGTMTIDFGVDGAVRHKREGVVATYGVNELVEVELDTDGAFDFTDSGTEDLAVAVHAFMGT